jgi:hypothetical protein
MLPNATTLANKMQLFMYEALANVSLNHHTKNLDTSHFYTQYSIVYIDDTVCRYLSVFSMAISGT